MIVTNQKNNLYNQNLVYNKPQLPKNESYLCTGTVTDPTKELYITGFEPMVTMNQAHHLMVIGEYPV